MISNALRHMVAENLRILNVKKSGPFDLIDPDEVERVLGLDSDHNFWFTANSVYQLADLIDPYSGRRAKPTGKRKVKLYLVNDCGGEREDAWSEPVIAFANQEDATRCLDTHCADCRFYQVKQSKGLIMNNQLTPCYVSEMPGEKARALLIDFAVEAWTHPASPFINGFPAGQESHPRAIVMFETGDVRCVHVNAVQVIGAEGIFSEYAFPKNDGSTSPI